MNPIHKAEMFASLPPLWPAEDLLPRIGSAVAESRRKVVVIDDDPTGTQTVHHVPVLTTWTVEALTGEFESPHPCFFLLTNTRAFPEAEAVRIHHEIGRNLTAVAVRHAAPRDFVVVSRSDSTLRGHFPAEVDALGAALSPGLPAADRIGRRHLPPVLLVPYFEAGGRYTLHDIHYVAEKDLLIPAAQTPFAQDPAFGYRRSNLREWVEEKTRGAVRATDVVSLSLADIRQGGPDILRRKLMALDEGAVCMANVAAPRDLEVIAWAALQAEAAGCRILYRTAADFVAARLGMASHFPWNPGPAATKTGGLTVVGSFVPRTTLQLKRLLTQSDAVRVEISVREVLRADARTATLFRAVRETNTALEKGRDVVVFTSRDVVKGAEPQSSLSIGAAVSEALVELVHRLEQRPGFLIAKGGITSSDVATRGLGVKRAWVLGQLLPGVPVWELGPETKWPGLPYVIFPGNVGAEDALVKAVKLLTP